MTDSGIVDTWEAFGLRCQIRYGFLCFNGYVQIPEYLFSEDTARDVIAAHGGITYGPDEEHWVGFDPVHHRDRWALDDLLPYISEGELLAYQLRQQFDTEDRRRDTHRWTLTELRQHTEAIAQQVALALDLKDIGMPPDPDTLPTVTHQKAIDEHE